MIDSRSQVVTLISRVVCRPISYVSAAVGKKTKPQSKETNWEVAYHMVCIKTQGLPSTTTWLMLPQSALINIYKQQWQSENIESAYNT